jgi:hypothetical protein
VPVRGTGGRDGETAGNIGCEASDDSGDSETLWKRLADPSVERPHPLQFRLLLGHS